MKKTYDGYFIETHAAIKCWSKGRGQKREAHAALGPIFCGKEVINLLFLQRKP